VAVALEDDRPWAIRVIRGQIVGDVPTGNIYGLEGVRAKHTHTHTHTNIPLTRLRVRQGCGFVSLLCSALDMVYSRRLYFSVSPSLRLSVSPSLRHSVSPSLRLSVSPSLRLSVSPSPYIQLRDLAGHLSRNPSLRKAAKPAARRNSGSVLGDYLHKFMGGRGATGK